MASRDCGFEKIILIISGICPHTGVGSYKNTRTQERFLIWAVSPGTPPPFMSHCVDRVEPIDAHRGQA